MHHSTHSIYLCFVTRQRQPKLKEMAEYDPDAVTFDEDEEDAQPVRAFCWGARDPACTGTSSCPLWGRLGKRAARG